MKKQTAVQQAITMVRNRIDSQIDTLMGKHTTHHLQQVERLLYELLEEEKEQIMESFLDGYRSHPYLAEEYYKETYGDDT
jgi:ATP-dependent DNA ligase